VGKGFTDLKLVVTGQHDFGGYQVSDLEARRQHAAI
jgi:hypothetical protein